MNGPFFIYYLKKWHSGKRQLLQEKRKMKPSEAIISQPDRTTNQSHV